MERYAIQEGWQEEWIISRNLERRIRRIDYHEDLGTYYAKYTYVQY